MHRAHFRQHQYVKAVYQAKSLAPSDKLKRLNRIDQLFEDRDTEVKDMNGRCIKKTGATE